MLYDVGTVIGMKDVRACPDVSMEHATGWLVVSISTSTSCLLMTGGGNEEKDDE